MTPDLTTAVARVLLRGPLPSDRLREEVTLEVCRAVTPRQLGEALHEMRRDLSVRVEYGPGGTHVAGPRARYYAEEA